MPINDSKVHPAVGCTHTSAWHKEGKPCSVCGAPRFDEQEIEALQRRLDMAR